jgi:hypothetical protein
VLIVTVFGCSFESCSSEGLGGVFYFTGRRNSANLESCSFATVTSGLAGGVVAFEREGELRFIML